MSNIDPASWHYGGNYPKGLPPEKGGTRIGMYLAWVVHRNLGSDELGQLGGDTYRQVLERTATGRDLLGARRKVLRSTPERRRSRVHRCLLRDQRLR